MELEGLSALLTPEGWALLESLPPYDEQQAMPLAERLRAAGHEPALVSAALTQSRLRAAGRAKFGPFAAGMLFTSTGLEQATRLSVAARHAKRFASAGIERVADLGCGIGGDSMALAGLEREVLAIEQDELTAAIATVNLRHWPEAQVACQDATAADLSSVGGAFCDPSRRTRSGKRVLDPRHATPPLSFITKLAEALPGVGMKAAPGIGHQLIPTEAEAQWVSVDGDVVEATLWFGLTARSDVHRSALLLSDEQPLDGAAGAASPVEVTDIDLPEPEVGPVGQVLYEPDGAVIRAGLVMQAAAAVKGRLIDRSIAYVTGDHLVRTPLATAYWIDDVFGFNLKTLRVWVRDRQIGRLTIKKRGTAVEPEQLRQQLRLSGENEGTIVLTRVAGRQSVIAVRPVGAG